MRRVASSALAVVLLIFVALASAARPKWHQLDGYTFDKYVKDFGRGYKKHTGEYEMRKAVFEERIASVRAHNSDPTQTWKRGVNMFSDMTAEEWKAFNRFRKSQKSAGLATVFQAGNSTAPLPASVDYRTWNKPRVLTAVKHQGSCGNCWAHSATQSIESYFALLTGRLPVLSTQQITACTPECGGCNGGDQDEGFWYINSTYHGLTEEWAYPFSDFFFNISNQSAVTSSCLNVTDLYPNKTPYTWFAELTRVGVTNVVDINPNDAHTAKVTLATTGPLSVSVAAGNWQDYETGVFQNTNATGGANEWQIDHAVQMVGYGHDKVLNMDYWIVRNSWSTNWGEDGFIRLDRPAVEPCAPFWYGFVCGTSGVLSGPSYPVVVELQPTDF